MEIFDVKISTTKENNGNEIANRFYQSCNFCEKLVRVDKLNLKSCCNLSGDKFFCPFCIRHNFHYRSNRNVLIFSFRAIIAYYYYRKYCSPTTPDTMYFSKIKDMIELHIKVGMQNPTFCYDQFTMLWFIDFNKIGKDRTKAPYEEAEATASAILRSLKLDDNIRTYAHDDIWKKFHEPLRTFYEKRQRPKDRRMLIPTLYGTVYGEKPEFFDYTRNFTLSDLEIL